MMTDRGWFRGARRQGVFRTSTNIVRRQQLRRGGIAVVLAAAVGLTLPASTHAEDDYPGLPEIPPGFGQTWGGAAQGGISYAKRAKQWFRSPDGMVTFYTTVAAESSVPEVLKFSAKAEAYVVSPDGAPDKYGYMPTMTVRSVGFGLMPVEATVQISQRRENGYPVPVRTTMSGTDYKPPGGMGNRIRQVADDTVVKDAFNVRILQAKVDGQDLGLTGNCRTVTPAPFTMIGPGYTMEDPDQPPHDPSVDNSYMAEWFRTTDPDTWFNPLWGGSLKGTITIPPFTGCTTKMGDDLSELMTLSVSGPDNPVSARVGWVCTAPRGYPIPPGAATPKLTQGRTTGGLGVDHCNGTETFDYPARP